MFERRVSGSHRDITPAVSVIIPMITRGKVTVTPGSWPYRYKNIILTVPRLCHLLNKVIITYVNVYVFENQLDFVLYFLTYLQW